MNFLGPRTPANQIIIKKPFRPLWQGRKSGRTRPFWLENQEVWRAGNVVQKLVYVRQHDGEATWIILLAIVRNKKVVPCSLLGTLFLFAGIRFITLNVFLLLSSDITTNVVNTHWAKTQSNVFMTVSFWSLQMD